MLVRKSKMVVGQTWGSAGTINDSVSTAVVTGAYVESRSLVEVVPSLSLLNSGVSYPNCIKIENRRTSHLGGNSFQRVSWYCAGQGLVKRIQLPAGLAGTAQIMELIDAQPASGG